MSAEPWSDRPKVDELALTDIFMRRVPTGGLNRNQEIPFSDVTAFIAGQSTVYVASEADLPPVGLDGFITLEYDKNYIFTEPANYTTSIAVPADWIGSIKKSFITSGAITFTGITMFFTIPEAGLITSIADSLFSPGVKSTISGINNYINGQFVNITGTTSYNQTRLQVSNVTATTFDVEIPFVGDETGEYNSGFRSMQFIDFAAENAAASFFMDLISSGDITSSILFTRVSVAGFVTPGIIQNAPNIVIRDCVFAFVTQGLAIRDTGAAIIETTNFTSLNPASTTARGFEILGTETKRVGVINSTFNMTNPSQHPVLIESVITNADEIIFQNSPDNLVATDYFDPAGLDETDPQVIATNNGTRKNSQTIAESSTMGILEVDGSGGVDVPIVDITPVAGDWIEDPATEGFTVDTTTGIVTCIGLRPVSVMIKYSASAAQTSGAAQTVELSLHINGIVQAKSQIIIVTSGVGTFIPGVYNGGNFVLSPGDTLQLFKNNTTNTNNTDITNTTLLINLD